MPSPHTSFPVSAAIAVVDMCLNMHSGGKSLICMRPSPCVILITTNLARHGYFVQTVQRSSFKTVQGC